jgi:chloramphenicol-sensitive protein RarD
VTVALGVVVLKEHLSRGQRLAVAVGFVAVVVLTADYGHPPRIALGLAFSFGTCGLIKKRVGIDAFESLSVETSVVALPALAYLIWLGASGDATATSEGAGHLALLIGSGAATAVPLLLFGAAAVRIPLVTLGLIQYPIPTLRLLIGVLVDGEPMSWTRLAGFGLGWVALVVFAADGVRRARPHALAEAVG